MGTNTELVQFVEKALKENWGYCLGSFGNTLTPSFLEQKLRQGYGVGAYNTRHKAYLEKYLNKRVSDCYGLVKAFIWWNNGKVKYVASQDRNQEGAYRAAKEKGPLKTIPEIPGLILWMKGHAGVYVGNGVFIECVGAPIGMRKGTIRNGVVTSGSKFTHWFKDTYIEYEESGINIIINGKQRKVNGYIKDGVSYLVIDKQNIPLRAIGEALEMKVGWNESKKAVLFDD